MHGVQPNSTPLPSTRHPQEYIRQYAQKYGLDRHIVYGAKVRPRSPADQRLAS
jgi:hypothetical protein